jgi:hypothetical protein
MKVRYYIPTTEQEQDELLATVKRLFPDSTPEVTERAVGVDFDFAKMDTFADLLNIQPSQIVKRPHVTFTIEIVDRFTPTPEQEALLTRPGVEHRRDFDVSEVLGHLER